MPNILSPQLTILDQKISEHACESIDSPESLPYESNHATKVLQSEDFLTIQ